MKHTVAVLDFRPLRKNTLVGFARVHVNELKLVIHDVALHEKGTARWASLPAKPQVKDGSLVTDDDGKVAYWTVQFCCSRRGDGFKSWGGPGGRPARPAFSLRTNVGQGAAAPVGAVAFDMIIAKTCSGAARADTNARTVVCNGRMSKGGGRAETNPTAKPVTVGDGIDHSCSRLVKDNPLGAPTPH
jgi:hypothetical protein